MWCPEHSVDYLQPGLVTVWSMLWPKMAAEDFEAVAKIGDIVYVLALQLLLSEILNKLERKLHAGGETALGHFRQQEVCTVGQGVEQSCHCSGCQLVRLLKLFLNQAEPFLVSKLVDQVAEPAVLLSVVGVWCVWSLRILRPGETNYGTE